MFKSNWNLPKWTQINQVPRPLRCVKAILESCRCSYYSRSYWISLTVRISILGHGVDLLVGQDLYMFAAGPAVKLVDPDQPAARAVRHFALFAYMLREIRRGLIGYLSEIRRHYLLIYLKFTRSVARLRVVDGTEAQRENASVCFSHFFLSFFGFFVCLCFGVVVGGNCNKFQKSGCQMKLTGSKKTHGVITGCAYRRMRAAMPRRRRKKDVVWLK